jgi:DNA-binding transcriptional MerR regulator
MTGFDQACTLPTAQRPLRLAEFGHLFATALRDQERVSPTALRWTLSATPVASLHRDVLDLVARETRCCSFFTFTVTLDGDTIRVDVDVPATHTAVLDALADQAAAAMREPIDPVADFRAAPLSGDTFADRTPTGSALRSSQLATAAGVNLQTLRYYERRGLLAAPDRTPGNHRLYRPEAVTRLRVIKAAQRLGFTLDEIAALLNPGYQNHRHGVTDRGAGLQAHARAKLTEIEARIADLQTIAGSLRSAVDAGCDDLLTCAAEPRCPIPFTLG